MEGRGQKKRMVSNNMRKEGRRCEEREEEGREERGERKGRG